MIRTSKSTGTVLWIMTAWICAGCLWTAHAQSADTIKARFAAFFNSSTTDTYGKMVWLKKNASEGEPDEGPGEILAMDTKDGIIRTLVPYVNGTSYTAPCITWDGKYLIYFEVEGLAVHRVDMETGTDDIILNNFEGYGRCWASDDGKQWVITTEFKGDGVNGARLYRVNIEDPSEKVLLLTCSSWGRPGYGGATQWASMSGDGKYVVGGFPEYGALGWFEVSDPAPNSISHWLNPNGCYPTISRDDQHHILHTDNSNLAHKQLFIQDINGNQILAKPLLAAGVLKENDEIFETLRWSNHYDYCTFHSSTHNGWTFQPDGFANPKIVRISDLAFVPIYDNCTTLQGNCDLFVYNSSGSSRNRARITDMRLGNLGGNQPIAEFDLRGRASVRTAATGKGLRVSANATASRARLIMKNGD